MVLVARDVRGHWPDHVQRDTTSDGTLAFGHSRSGFTRGPVAQQCREQPSLGANMSRSSRRPRTPGFQSGNAGSSPARDARTRNPRRAQASGAEIGRNDRAAPEPVTGWILHHATCSVNSVARVPACLAGSRGFDSRTGRQIAEIAQSVERRVESACAGGSNPSLGTRQNLVSSTGQERRSTKPGVARSSRARGANRGVAERRPPKPKVRGSIPWSCAKTSRRSQVVEGDGLQSRRRKPASVRIGPSSPCLVSSEDRAAGF